jgi:ethanolamine utilization protein EutA
MADAVMDVLTGSQWSEPPLDLYLTEPLGDVGRLDGVMFSGGVAEYVYGRETRDFGDLGRRLGAAIRRRVDAGALPAPVLPAGECIRATVLGASEHTVQLSGNTSYISNPEALLPRRNLQVLRPDYRVAEEVDPDDVATAIRKHLAAFDHAGDVEAGGDGVADVVLALAWRGAPSYARILGLARGIVSGLEDRTARRFPLYLMLDGDVALTLGTLLREELGVASELLVIDGVSLWDFDYVDLGTPRWPSNTVPVTIKSLVFDRGSDPTGSPHGSRSHAG